VTQRVAKSSFIERDATSVACMRATLGMRIGRRLNDAATAANDAEEMAVADMILEAARVENHSVADGAHNEDGELFEGVHAFKFPASRLDPNYMAFTRRRARKELEKSLSRVRPQSGEMERFVTFSMPKLVGVGAKQTLAVLRDAWTRFRKSDYWQCLRRGAVSAEEFTLGDSRILEEEDRAWDFYVDGLHAHIHCIVWSKWIVWAELGEQWTKCVEKAFKKFGYDFQLNTSHGRCVVDIRLCTVGKRKGKGTIAHAGAIQEVAKYICKGSAFLDLPDDQLCAVERALHGRRMLEKHGECRSPGGAVPVRCEVRAEDSPQYSAIRERGRLRQLEWMSADPRLGTPNPDSPALTDWHCTIDKDAHLDTPHTKDGFRSFAEARDGPVFTRRWRAPSLRKVGIEMIGRGEREKWREMLREVFIETREWRKSALIQKYPYAVFRVLDGDVFYGLRANPASSKPSAGLQRAEHIEPPPSVKHARERERVHPQGRNIVEHSERSGELHE
jgi:hypothetical protein